MCFARVTEAQGQEDESKFSLGPHTRGSLLGCGDHEFRGWCVYRPLSPALPGVFEGVRYLGLVH